jgi:AcrR family transcriptional regulator
MTTRVSKSKEIRRKASLKPRKQPSQERSVYTVNSILEAAARILEKHGPEGFNTNAVAERAGVSIGSLYQYFPHKDVLTVALIERFEQEHHAALQDALKAAEGKPLHDGVREIARASIEFHARRPKLNRILEFEENRLLQGSETDSESSVYSLITDFLIAHRDEIAVIDFSEAAGDLLVIVRALVDTGLRLDNFHDLETRVVRAVMGYLSYPVICACR